ncbi:tetratricopeptide repeat protein 17 isoform X2 [Cylas formicarius]|uniref:tetratricopeptide repeat protein 17 isoform X2 n=1 Tax=Cylas formicarius TaxID=197179 RepID=UPI00295838AC|nr:tetratricopeptide repeat protein 17 isoform X2 [Cylas formicarius]
MVFKIMRNILIFCIVTFQASHAVNHWIVTQSGKIQAYLDSPFDLRQPNDLLALLDQETRWNDLNNLYADLIERKGAIEKKWTEIEKKPEATVLKGPSECVLSGKSVSDFNLYPTLASNGTERGVIFNLPYADLSKNSVVPLCDNFNKLKRIGTSMNGTVIVLPPDEALVQQFMPVMSLDNFGNYISSELLKNSTSWIHYNLASFYWRVKGNGNKAIDCLKLAIQFVTEGYRDIPLYNLAGILHHSGHSKEAAQVLQSAIDIAPHESMHLFAIANIFASLREYDRSLHYYDEFLKTKPGDKEVGSIRNFIECYSKWERTLTTFQRDLQEVLDDLHEYHSLQQRWLRLQERVIWEHASFNYHGVPTNDLHLEVRTRQVQRCVQKTSGHSKKPVISCDFYDKGLDVADLNLQNLHELIENERAKLNEQLRDILKSSPEQLKPTLKDSFYFDAGGWPANEECLLWNIPVNERDNLNLPVVLPPENKGYSIKLILSEYIGLPEGSQQALPWYPPLCESDNVNGEKYLPAGEKSVLDMPLKSNKYLKDHLLKYVNNGRADEAEIGQRIIAATEKKVAPKWVLAVLASLYWRVRGNARRAIDCLDMAFQAVPEDQTDLVLVPLASILHQLGFRGRSMEFATLALKINYHEPSTNFLLALLHHGNGNPLLATYYMKNVLRADRDFYDGTAETLLKTWGCRTRLGTGSTELKPTSLTEQMCSKMEPTRGVTCRDGATLYCYKKTEQDTSDVIEEKSNLGQTIISSLLAAEGDPEPDQSKLETLSEDAKGFMLSQVHHHVHMRLSLGEQPEGERRGLNDFFVSVALSESPDLENRLHVYDRFGTYTLSNTVCRTTDVSEPLKYFTVWPSIVSRSLDLTSSLKSAKNSVEDSRPRCSRASDLQLPPRHYIDEFAERLMRGSVAAAPDENLAELLALMAGNQKLSVDELGARIASTLSEDETSWVMLTASAIYWTIVGDYEQAMVCFRGALSQVPEASMDIPSIYLAHLLNRAGLYREALEAANVALKAHPNFVLNHFTVAEIYISAGENEKAIGFLRACLSLDSNFEPARSKLKALLCKILFDDSSDTSPTRVARHIVDVLN